MAKRTRGTIQSKFYAKTRQEWQNWMENNHNKPNEIWLIFYRPHTERQNIGYEESLEVAASFDWKQTLIKRIDDDSFARKFIPITSVQKKKSEKPTEPEKEISKPKREEKQKETKVLPPVFAEDFELEIFDEIEDEIKVESTDDSETERDSENPMIVETPEESGDDVFKDEVELEADDTSKPEQPKEKPATVIEIAEEEKETEFEDAEEYLTFESEFGKDDIDSEGSEDIYEDVEWKTNLAISDPEKIKPEAEQTLDLDFEEINEELDIESEKPKT